MTAESGKPSASAAPSGLERLLVAGIDHRSAGQVLRDRVFFDGAALPGAYRRLREAGLHQPVLLATCDRVLVAAFSGAPEAGTSAVRRVMAAAAGLPEGRLEESLLAREGTEALRHLFAIAASLESRVVGEPEVLGQVKAAYRAATASGGGGPEMGRVFDGALAAAKRIRSETGIGENAVSIVAAARQVAGEVLGRFGDATALVVGAGEIGILVAERLAAQGLADIWVADPLAPRAEALAARLGAHGLAMEGIDAALEGMDIVIAGLGGPAPAITARAVAGALRRRRFRPMFLLDAAVPPDIEPAAGELDGAYLFTLHDLERIALAGREGRSRAAAEARAMVLEEVAAFALAEGRRAAAPTVAALRAHFEEVRRRLLEENPGISAEQATRLLVNRLLNEPSRLLGDLAAAGASGRGAEPLDRDLIARLFGVAPAPGEEGAAGRRAAGSGEKRKENG